MQRVAVVGSRGYVGAELCTQLGRHARVTLVTEDDVRPGDTVFLATPHEASAERAPRLLRDGARVVDLSGAFRLRHAAAYPTFYGFEHPAPELLASAVYGMPEWNAPALAGAPLVASPGCYATSVVLALRPLLPLLDPAQAIVCDACSGVSGAGRKADVAYSFAEVAGNFKAYGVASHRHEPEMRQELNLGPERPFVFVPHLLPVVRGILSTLHVAFEAPATADDVAERYRAAYHAAPFVRVRAAGELPEMRDVVGTPRCDIGFVVKDGGRRAVIVSALDNLLKGASSQAIQAFNLTQGWDVREGLL